MSFPAYSKYKDSGVEWLGQIPFDWKMIALRRVLKKSLSNGIFKKKEEFGQGVPLINVFDVYRNDFKVDHLSLERVNCEKNEIDTYSVEEGDLFFVRSSLKYEGISVVAVADFYCEKTVYECHLILARPDQKIFNGRYGSYLFNSKVYRALMISKAKLTTMTTIDQEAISSTLIPIPTIQEQTKIARFLDHETARIDALIEEQKRLIELLKEKRQSIALISYLDKNVQKMRLAHAVDIISRPVHQVDGETYIPLGLYNRDRGLFHKEPREKNEMGDSDFFWIEPGDLIISGQFAWEGALALASQDENETVVSHRYPVLRGKKGVIETEFLYAFLATKHGDFLFNESSRGAAGRNRPLNLSSLLKEEISIPSKIFQREVCELVRKEALVLLECNKQIQLLQERRSALISAAVTGKIDVRGWQPQASTAVPSLERE